MATIGDTKVLITAKGDIVRVEDGALLAKSIAKVTYSGPVMDDGVVYFIEHDQQTSKAFRLPDEITDDSVAVEKLWESKPAKERYYASPVVREGLIYALNQRGVFSVMDAATGEVVYEQRLDFGKGTCYPSPTLAGEFVLLSCYNGVSYVVKTGREYQEVARNTLEPFRACPVFVGDNMYIRGQKNLYCIGQAE